VSRDEQQPESTNAAAAIRDFYDRYPYPPPLTDLDPYRQYWADAQRRRAEFHLHWPWRALREDHTILVAGCGTQQAAKHAVRWPSAQVTGIDFSERSVRATLELKGKFRLDNLTVRELAIERAEELRDQFDHVVCTGVLHHLPDPAAGLAALRNVLKPDGVMQLMVYAPYGRAGIYMIQEFCRRTGVVASEQGIRLLMVALRSLPGDHPIARLLRDAPDFSSVSGFADALLNPQDRAYSVPQLFQLLDDNGLRFVRWVRQAPYSARCGILATLPQSAHMTRLAPPEESAAAELFRGTMVRHSVILYRADHPWTSRAMRFSGREFLAAVPLRLSDTVVIREHLPHGAAAVLRSRSHAYADTILPVTEGELKLLEAIDGQCRVADLTCQERQPGLAASLLERLWWHDQIVFDASATHITG